MSRLAELTRVFQERREDLLRVFRKLGWNETEGEDLLQDAYINAQRNIHSFRGDSKLFSWVLGIARNVGKNKLRFHTQQKRDRGKESSLDDPGLHGTIQTGTGDPESRVLAKEQFEFMMAEVNKMPDKMQACFRLHYIEGETVAGVATILRMSENTVKSHNFEARRRLKKARTRYLDGRHE